MQNELMSIANLERMIPLVCQEYHIFGRVMECKPLYPKAKPEYYIIAGLNGVPAKVDPKLIAKRNFQSFKLFYPHLFALKVDENTNPLDLIEKTVEYCKEAEFIKAIYNEFKCPIPYVIRVDELYSLQRFSEQRANNNLTAAGKQNFHKELMQFFRKEKTKNPYKIAWKKHYRSERFNENLSLIRQYINFFKRNNPEVDIEILQRSCDDLKSVSLDEKAYCYFKKQIKKLYPDISYSVGKKCVVDHGIIKMPKGVENPFGESVTFDEFFKRREQTFADMGFEGIKNLNVSKWAFRDLTYRAVDEPIIASILSPYRFGYIKDSQLSTVQAFGEVDVISVPEEDIMNFYSLAKSYGLVFHIDDRGQYKEATLHHVHVVYARVSQPIVDKIVNQLVGDKIVGSHMTTEKQKKHLLTNQINAARIEDSCNIGNLSKPKNKKQDVWIE